MARCIHENQIALGGLRVLVVEDEFFIALDVEAGLRQLNCEPVGPAATIADALSIIAASGRLDGALLDLNLDAGFAGDRGAEEEGYALYTLDRLRQSRRRTSSVA